VDTVEADAYMRGDSGANNLESKAKEENGDAVLQDAL
jgi:hypothetical protein